MVALRFALRLFALSSALGGASALLADDGIWLFNEFPRQLIQQKYGFTVSDDFLEKLRLGSVRFNNGGSGSFVSSEGLVFTNHHVGADCIQKLSSKEQDYMRNGFQANARAEEKACPDLELNILVSIENVTEKVKADLPASMAPSEANQKRKAKMSEIEKACAARTGNRCDVVTLFSGGQYHLYEYKKYTDVRLVFAPEKDIAFFGGDPDNFTYPRWNLDVTFFRAYENGQPVKPKHFFPWSKTGARNGELTFVSGNPGSTGRLQTLAELEFARDVQIPMALRRSGELTKALQTFSQRGPEQARVALEEIFGLQNSFKAYTGFMGGLKDPAFMAQKQSQEKALRASISKDAAKETLYGSAFDEIAKVVKDYRSFYVPFYLFEATPARGSQLMEIGHTVYRYAVEKAKPNGERLREFSDAGLESVEQGMYSTAPIDLAMEEVGIAEYLRFAVQELGASDEVVQKLLRGRTPAEAARQAVASSRLKDVSYRKELAASVQAAEASTDGVMELVRILDGPGRRYRKMYEDRVQARLAVETARIAQAQYSLGGNVYPDATFTLRLSFGPVKGYKNAQGKSVAWATDFAGMYAHATGKDPFALPERWLKAKPALKLNTPFNFVTTADTHGGNSGSPTLNTKGEVIGILFDGNLEGLPNRYLFTDKSARSVHVATQGINESLRKVYQAEALLKELGAN
jgi:hypothetical protein